MSLGRSTFQISCYIGRQSCFLTGVHRPSVPLVLTKEASLSWPRSRKVVLSKVVNVVSLSAEGLYMQSSIYRALYIGPLYIGLIYIYIYVGPCVQSPIYMALCIGPLYILVPVYGAPYIGTLYIQCPYIQASIYRAPIYRDPVYRAPIYRPL